MEESNFRFYGFGQDNNTNSLFYNDVFLLMSQRQLNPTISILISIENENDFLANSFWADNRVIQLLTNSGAKAIRIKKESQQNDYQQFNELFCVQSIPSLYVFGPSSTGPSFIYSSTYPDYQKFASDFSTLTYSPTPAFYPPQPQQQPPQQQPPQQQPPQQQPPQQPPQQLPQQTSQQQEQPITPTQQSPNMQQNPQQDAQRKQDQHTNNTFDDEFVRRRTKNKPQQQKQKKEIPEIPVEVTVTTPDKKIHTDTFKSTDNCLTIRVWISKLIGKPHTAYKLIVIPGNFVLPLSDKIFLLQYAPKLSLRVELIAANIQAKPKLNKFMPYVSNFLSQISIFADPEDDPSDFWRTEPVYRRNNQRK